MVVLYIITASGGGVTQTHSPQSLSGLYRVSAADICTG